MAFGEKCPYCNGRYAKIASRIVRQPSHLTYGYGERRYRCVSCKEEFSSHYTIPPKGSIKELTDTNPGILKVTFREGISGFANRVVLTARNVRCKRIEKSETVQPEIPTTSEDPVS